MTCNNMAHLAESGRLHALLMGLEHRYYGGKAFDGVMNFSIENLKFLSSHSICYSCLLAYPKWWFFNITLSEILFGGWIGFLPIPKRATEDKYAD